MSLNIDFKNREALTITDFEFLSHYLKSQMKKYVLGSFRRGKAYSKKL